MAKDPRLNAPANFNDEVQDRVIRHMLYLESLKTKQAREAVEFLDKDILPDLLEQLTARLNRIEIFGFDRGAETTQRLEAMIAQLSTITGRFANFNTRIQGELFALGQNEIEWQTKLLNETAGINLGLVAVAPEQLRQVLFNKPFDGRTLEQWFERLSESSQTRLAQEIRRGVTEGQTTAQIVRKIQAGGYIANTRKQTDAVVRTATAHASNAARQSLFDENEDIIKGVQWVATLDSRTCLQCSPLDGKVFEINKGPRPPLHVSCRCTVTPVTKSFKELGIDIEDLPLETRASMNGQVAGNITYNQWLKKQPIEVQELALGKTKAKLFRDGNLSVEQFVNRNRVELTLEELRKKDPAAFNKIGL